MSFIIIGFYRPPTANDTFYDEFADILKECDHNKEIIIMGDFNLNWEDKSKRRKLKVITDKYHLEQLIKGPTRITKCSSTQLDLFFSNKPERITKTYNLITGLSDHNLTLVARKLTSKRFKINASASRHTNVNCIPKSKQETFDNEINNLDWGDILSSENLENSCQLFTSKINIVRDKHIVKNKRKNKNKVNLPWFSEILWQLMKSKDAALKKAIKTKRDTDILVYKNLRNKVINELRLAKSHFFLKLLNDAKGNSSEIWKSINSLLGRAQHHTEDIQLTVQGQTIDDNAKIASIFNSFFIDSVQRLGNNFKTGEQLTDLNVAGQGFDLVTVTEEEVKKVICSLKNSKSKDVSHQDTVFIKKHSTTLIPPITHLANLSIIQSFFPPHWKQAIVTPIFKSGDRNIVSNYRPISILPVISKIVEKIVIDQLTDHINSCNPGLDSAQFGFTKHHSTETAILHLTEQIRLGLDKGGVVGAVFLDLSKAFDTVNHKVLLSKLSNVNLSSNTLAWISSYLSDRRQCVKIKDADSSYLSHNAFTFYEPKWAPEARCLAFLPSLSGSPVLWGQVFSKADPFFFTHRRSPRLSPDVISHCTSRKKNDDLSMLVLCRSPHSVDNVDRFVHLCHLVQSNSTQKLNHFCSDIFIHFFLFPLIRRHHRCLYLS
ncbi:hypothetical protein JOB18_045141 [Solea senegalensis]|uniref:Reverse transcriptase domain-containing protein n=1 Tax=Solea senegalensis TaxID=28829 RepID=A0AAV6TCG1_SOLSE|nr:hypothetical protein JOB18_045141 [Solea senegalensis]